MDTKQIPVGPEPRIERLVGMLDDLLREKLDASGRFRPTQ
jgi:hypothetical protein